MLKNPIKFQWSIQILLFNLKYFEDVLFNAL
jgi:hypothetical protein